MDQSRATKSDRSPHKTGADWLIAGFSGVALAMSIFLYIHDLDKQAALPGCGGDSSCSQVINSRWATWAGMPVVVLGLVAYLGIFIIGITMACTQSRFHAVGLWSALCVLSLTGIGFIIWLMGLQWLHIGRFCIYCLVNHLLGLITFGVVLRQAPPWCTTPPRRAFLLGSVPSLLGAMIAIHITMSPQQITAQTTDQLNLSQTSESGFRLGVTKPSREVSLMGGKLSFDLYAVPLEGSPTAQQVVVELFDYACPSCRDLHEQLSAYRKNHQADLAIVRLVVPMHPDCNAHVKRKYGGYFKYSCIYARNALAVWIAKPEVYTRYHDWMMKPGKPPTPEKAREKAVALVGEAAFLQALKHPTVDPWIQQGADMLNFLGSDQVPKLIAGKTVISYGSSTRKTFDETLSRALKTPAN